MFKEISGLVSYFLKHLLISTDRVKCYTHFLSNKKKMLNYTRDAPLTNVKLYTK